MELNDIGRAFNEVGQYEKAKYVLLKALEIDPYYAVALNNLGISFYYQKDYVKAKEYYNTAKENDPYDALAWSNLSEIYDIEGKYDKAMEMANEALTLNPNLYEALFFYAHANYKKGNYEDAIKYYNKALDVDDFEKLSFTLKDYRVWYHLGEAYFQIFMYEKALVACEKCKEIRKDYLPVENLIKKIKKHQKYNH